MRFVETPVFTRAIRAAIDDESYRALQVALMLRRGGPRVIYFWDAKSSSFYMLDVYAKNEQGDLTAAQLRLLSALVREEFK